MECHGVADERVQADLMDVLYGEADPDVRTRVEAHLAQCPACREELAALRGLRRDLAAWQQPRTPRLLASTPRGYLVPRWLAAAAALLLGVSLPLGATGVLSVRRALAEQQARAEALERRHHETRLALERALARPGAAAGLDEQAVAAAVDRRLAERLRAAEERQARQLDARLAEWSGRIEAQRRVDLTRVAEGLSDLDGRHGQQLARQNELLRYVLTGASGRQ